MMVLKDPVIHKPVLNEEQHIREAQRSPEGFRPIYEKYHRSILQYVYNKTDDLNTAADITSTIFLKALTHIHRYTIGAVPFAAWLYKIAFNECLQYHRHSKRQRKVYVAATFLHEFSSATQEHVEDLKVHLQSVLPKLKETELNLLELRYWEEKSIRDIAYILGLSESNVKVRLHRLHQKLKKEITQTALL